MRNRAEAIAAPVFPAETMAAALPSRTASAARTRVASFLRRTPPAGSSPMPITSEADIRGSPSVSRPSGPTMTTSIPSSSTARRAPATIAPGASSPPMASTAMGSISWAGSDFDGDAVLVPTARGAHHVRELGRPAPRAERAGRLRESPRAGPVAARLRLGSLLLGDSHRLVPLVGRPRPDVGPEGGATLPATRGGRRLSGRLRGWPAARRARPSGDRRPPRRSRTAPRCGQHRTSGRSQRSRRDTAVPPGSSISTSSRTIGPRSSCSPSNGNASSDVGWTW